MSILIFRSIGASFLVIVSSNPYLITVLGCVSVWEKTSLMLADDKPNRIHIRYTQRFLSQNPRPITSALSKTVKFLLYNLTFLSNISNKKSYLFSFFISIWISLSVLSHPLVKNQILRKTIWVNALPACGVNIIQLCIVQ